MTDERLPAPVGLNPTTREPGPLPWTERLGYIILLGVALGGALGAEQGITLAALLVPIFIVVIARPHQVVMLLTATVPFEDFILKWLPVNDTVYGLSRFISEVTLYAAFGAMIISYIVSGRRFRRTPLDIPLVVYGVIALLSLLVNHSPVLGAALNIRPFVRYIVLFYLVVNLDLTDRDMKLLLQILIWSGIAQVIVGVAEILGGNAVSNLFLPRISALTVGDVSQSSTLVTKGREIGAIFGTVSDTVIFGGFCVVLTAVSLGRIRRFKMLTLLWLSALLVLTAYSYSRASLIVCMGTIMWWFRLRYGWKPMLQLSFGGGLVLVAILVPIIITAPSQYINPSRTKASILANMTDVFNGNYLQIAEKQRLGSLIGNVPTVLVNKPLLGYGPDQDTAIDHLNKSQHSFLLKVWSTSGFKDVYWVALLTFYGVLGLGAIIAMFRRLFTAAMRIRSTSKNRLTVDFANGTSCLIIATSVILLFYRALEFRQYGFYFWLWPAVMLSAWQQEVERGEEVLS